jgi:hypothetical protein
MDAKDTPADSEPDLEQFDVVAPCEAPAFLALIERATAAGVDVEVLRGMLWLLNAHPRLLGHRRCLANLGEMLSVPSLVDRLADWAGEWQQQIPEWHSIIGWAASLQPAHDDQLEPFFNEPRHPTHHVLMRHGMTRHPMTSALWTRHHADPEPDPPHARLSPASRAFRLLQWHVFCIHAEFRARTSSVQQYLHYAGRDEWPAVPMRTDDAGRAVRELSHPEYDDLLQTLPLEDSTFDYAIELISGQDDLLELAELVDAGARAVALLRYFNTFLELVAGSDVARTARATSHGRKTGSRKTVPGFVHFGAAPRVLFEPAAQASSDEDIPTRDFARIHVSARALTTQVLIELESQGLAPQEEAQPILDLFPAGERAGGMNSLWMQRQALEAAAQRHAWDRRNLTPFEVGAVVRVLEESAPRLCADATDKLVTREASLAVLGMLLLGCNLLDVLGLGIVSRERFAEMISSASPLPFGRWLVHDELETCAGIAVTSIQPAYRTPQSSAFASCAERALPFLLLPDVAGFGAGLLSHIQQFGPPDGKVFSSDIAALTPEVDGFLKRANQQLDPDSRGRVTLAKVRDKVASLLTRAGLDETAVAIITADRDCTGQARLHYTQHLVSRLQEAYRKATKRMLREAGITQMLASSPGVIEVPTKDAAHQPQGTAGGVVGARLIVAKNHLRDFVGRMRDRLERVPERSRSAWHAYHDAFILYTVVIQHMTTGVRLSSTPQRFMKSLLEAEATMASAGRDAHLLIEAVADKDDQYVARARATPIPDRLETQLYFLAVHAQAAWRWMPSDLVMPSDDAAELAFVSWADGPGPRRASVVQPGWIATQLAELGLPVPANFHRGYLRTHLLRNGCPQQSVDAFLGHANVGETPHVRHGSFDYDVYRQTIDRYVCDICDEIGLVPISSRLA